MPEAPDIIRELVERYDSNRDQYTGEPYNEEQARAEFINPFFEALGWDVSNKEGYSPAYMDVLFEGTIRVDGGANAPDYTFRVGQTRKFFVEAKKPAVRINFDPDPARQIRRYSWTAKLPVGILTNFHEFAVYDCRIPPRQNDKVAYARLMYLTYKDYIGRWGEIAGIFSRDAVWKGAFDRYAQSEPRKTGTAEVDEQFLKQIEEWRAMLAKNLALRNPGLGVRELNYAVQSTIDRIVFLRICEDRGIESEGQLLAHMNGSNVYGRLLNLYYHADDKYNSGLFHFREEKGRHEEPDRFTPGLKIDDKVLKEIISGLYPPKSPYAFSVIGADILGNVYEQFLGKVIRLTPAHKAVVEEKPEVKKAGGVYYTPAYIVDYIVKNTVGKLCEGKTPRQVEKLRILDPACGSGSFLINAYAWLLNWHLDYYVKDGPEKHRKELSQVLGGEWRLSTKEKKRILLNNIYGVDIDSQAVEVTKLSLLLRVLEGESAETLDNSMRMFHERALPDLANNIKCGNSLIGTDFDTTGLSEDEVRRINPFDWNREFLETMSKGGFDVVIGNPPYIPIESMIPVEREYYQKNHAELERKYDSSVIFVLAGLQKLRSTGLLGYISSVTWQTGENFNHLRKHLFSSVGVISLVNLPFDVFKSAYVDTGIYILSAQPTDNYLIYSFPKKEKNPNLTEISFVQVPTTMLASPGYKVILKPAANAIMSRCLNDTRFDELGNLTISAQGLAGNRFRRCATPTNDDCYPFLEVGQVYRYVLDINRLAYVNMGEHESLKRFYEAMPKILIRRVINRQDRLMAAYTDVRLVFKKDINPFVITSPSTLEALFILAIINSRLTSYLYINTSTIATKDDFRQTTLAELRRLPIRRINLDDSSDKAGHDKIVCLTDRMLDLHRKLDAARIPGEKTRIQRQIDATDREIDQLVYELYGLTDEEIKIVETSE